MAATGYEEPEPSDIDPIWERILITGKIEEIIANEVGAMAIAITQNGTLFEVLSGEVDPFENGNSTYYTGLKATLVVAHTLTKVPSENSEYKRAATASLRFGDFPMTPIVYPLQINESQLQELLRSPNSYDIAWRDSHTRHKLERVKFSEKMSQTALFTLLANQPRPKPDPLT